MEMLGNFGNRRERIAAQDEAAAIVRADTPAQTIFGEVSDTRWLYTEDGRVDVGAIDDLTKSRDRAVLERLGGISSSQVRKEQDRIAHLNNVGGPELHRAETIASFPGIDQSTAMVMAQGVRPDSKKGRRLLAEYERPIGDLEQDLADSLQRLRDSTRGDR